MRKLTRPETPCSYFFQLYLLFLLELMKLIQPLFLRAVFYVVWFSIFLVKASFIHCIFLFPFPFSWHFFPCYFFPWRHFFTLQKIKCTVLFQSHTLGKTSRSVLIQMLQKSRDDTGSTKPDSQHQRLHFAERHDTVNKQQR